MNAAPTSPIVTPYAAAIWSFEEKSRITTPRQPARPPAFRHLRQIEHFAAFVAFGTADFATAAERHHRHRRRRGVRRSGTMGAGGLWNAKPITITAELLRRSVRIRRGARAPPGRRTPCTTPRSRSGREDADVGFCAFRQFRP